MDGKWWRLIFCLVGGEEFFSLAGFYWYTPSVRLSLIEFYFPGAQNSRLGWLAFVMGGIVCLTAPPKKRTWSEGAILKSMVLPSFTPHRKWGVEMIWDLFHDFTDENVKCFCDDDL